MFVKANVIDVTTGTEQHTNDFKFTWGETDPDGQTLKRMVVPQTYAGESHLHALNELIVLSGNQESMQWVEGRRALEYGAQIRGLRKIW